VAFQPGQDGDGDVRSGLAQRPWPPATGATIFEQNGSSKLASPATTNTFSLATSEAAQLFTARGHLKSRLRRALEGHSWRLNTEPGQQNQGSTKSRCSGGSQILTIGSELRVISPPGFGPAQALALALSSALRLTLSLTLAGSSGSNGSSG
jgi:hypothetical protein